MSETYCDNCEMVLRALDLITQTHHTLWDEIAARASGPVLNPERYTREHLLLIMRHFHRMAVGMSQIHNLNKEAATCSNTRSTSTSSSSTSTAPSDSANCTKAPATTAQGSGS